MIQRILTELKTKFWQWKYIPAIKKVVKSSIRSSTVMLGSFSATLKMWITFLAKFRINWQALATLLWNGNDDTEILQTAYTGFLGFLVGIWKLTMGMDCCHLWLYQYLHQMQPVFTKQNEKKQWNFNYYTHALSYSIKCLIKCTKWSGPQPGRYYDWGKNQKLVLPPVCYQGFLQ